MGVRHGLGKAGLGGRAGTAATATVLFALVFVAALALTVDYYRAFTAKGDFECSLERGAMIAMALSLSDLHRQDGILWMDAVKAESALRSYIREEMGFDESLVRRGPDGSRLAALESVRLTFVSEPPTIAVEGTVTFPPSMGLFAGLDVSVPFRVVVRDIRID